MAKITFRKGKFRRVIKKGNHYPERIFFPLMIRFKKLIPLMIKYAFTPSCLYDFDDNDEYDKNKLFGLSFVILPRIRTKKWKNKMIDSGYVVLPWFEFLGLVVINPIHWSSARICWNTVNKDGKIDIWSYIYDSGVRVKNLDKLAMIDIDKNYVFAVNMNKNINEVEFLVYNEKMSVVNGSHYKIRDVGFLFLYLDLYFGGNEAAPHDMAFYCTRY